ncbi:MAG: HAD family phosphatase [Patulibacter minatonensis]
MPDAPSPTVPAAVLWDMDGTLVDTEPYWFAAEYDIVERHGGTWNDEHAHAIVGSDLLAGAAYIQREGGIDLEPAAIVEALLEQVIARARERTPWQPGAVELLTALHEAGIPCALVTMSYASLAQTVVDQLPAGTFAAVVTGDLVEHGKPHPEPYLKAAALLGVDAADCVAIEDSPTGVASAEAARCHTLAVPHAVSIAPGPGRTVREEGLLGVDVDWIKAFAGGRAR